MVLQALAVVQQQQQQQVGWKEKATPPALLAVSHWQWLEGATGPPAESKNEKETNKQNTKAATSIRQKPP